MTVSPNGFSSEAQYLASPRGHVHGRTTRGFEPGPIPAGEWAVELGVAAVASQIEGDSRRQGRVAGRDRASATRATGRTSRTSRPPTTRVRPARARAGTPGTSTCTPSTRRSATRRCARRSTTRSRRCRATAASVPVPGPGLDFITLSDYVTDTGWGEIGRYQPDYPGKLIVAARRSSPTRVTRTITRASPTSTTAQGRCTSGTRTGPSSCGARARPASELFDGVHAGRWLHPDQPPDDLPFGGARLRLPLPRLPVGLHGCGDRLHEGRRDRDRDRAGGARAGPAAGAEPVHTAGDPVLGARDRRRTDRTATRSRRSGRATRTRPAAPTSSRTSRPRRSGQATTVVYADELSEQGIQRGVEAGHTYVKLFGNDGPDLRLEGPRSSGRPRSWATRSMRGHRASTSRRGF